MESGATIKENKPEWTLICVQNKSIQLRYFSKLKLRFSAFFSGLLTDLSTDGRTLFFKKDLKEGEGERDKEKKEK